MALQNPLYRFLASGAQLTEAATIVWAFDNKPKSVTLTDSRTLSITGLPAGFMQFGVLEVIHQVAGTILTLPGDATSVNWKTGAGESTLLTFYYNGNSFIWASQVAGSVTPVEDTTAPVAQSYVIQDSNHSRIVVAYNEALSSASVPATSDFVIMKGGSPVAVASVSISGNALRLDFGSAFVGGQQVHLSYTKGTNPIMDAAGNEAANIGSVIVTNEIDVAPSNIPADYRWKLDASNLASITKDGSDKVSEIIVANGISFVQATAAKQPLYVASGWNGQPVIRFDGVDDALTCTLNEALAEFTLMVVYKSNAAQSSARTIIEHTNRYGLRISAGTVVQGYLATANQTTPASSGIPETPDLNPSIAALKYKTGETKGMLKHNIHTLFSSSIKTGDVYTNSQYQLAIGGYSSGTNGYQNMDVAEIYFYNRCLTDVELAAVDTELSTKHAIA